MTRGEQPAGVRLWRCPGWSTLTGIDHAVSQRAGGTSSGPFAGLNLGLHVGDDPLAVVANRERAAAALAAPLASFVFADQVHGAHVGHVTAADAGRGTRELATALPATDALITGVPGLWLAILVADCVPVVVVDPLRRAVGIAHAGWRGTVQGVAGATVQTMSATFGCRPVDLRVLIGPSVGPGDYEVDEPVIDAVRRAFPADWQSLLSPTRPGHATLDLWAANRHQLAGAGVPHGNIAIAGVSTPRATARFYSVRGEGPVTGRFGVFVRLQPERAP